MSSSTHDAAAYKEDDMNGRYHGGDNLAPTRSAFGGALQPSPYNEQRFRKFANVAPLGLSAFALTTFILSLINCQVDGVKVPDIVIGAALGYGGLVQLLAGMWEVAIGNTFGAVALSSYGGFWISFAIIIIPPTAPQSFGVISAYGNNEAELNRALGFYLFGWFIFTTILLLCTLKSTLAFFSLFLFLDITFLLLGIAHFELDEAGAASASITKAGGIFGLITAFIAWYNALAGIVDNDNSFFSIPVVHLPWSAHVRKQKAAQDARV